MTGEEYLRQILGNYKPTELTASHVNEISRLIRDLVKTWAVGSWLNDVYPSGSFAKGTAVRGSTDLDLFVSFHPDTPGNLKELYSGLFSHFASSDFHPRIQNVSFRIVIAQLKMDIIPGRKQSGSTNDHSLYRTKLDSWTQTNVQAHIDLVRSSSRTEEIRLAKIWRDLHSLELSSFLLELCVLEAVRGAPKGDLGRNFNSVFAYLKDTFPAARITDPSNSNNVVSDELTNVEKATISREAGKAFAEQSWTRVVW